MAAIAAVASALIAYGAQSKTTEVTAQGQVFDRYQRAVATLGDPSLEVRLGGIYALGSVARDAPSLQPDVVRLLSSYIRRHVPAAGSLDCKNAPQGSGPPLNTEDSIAAITVLAQRDHARDASATVNLSAVCLHGITDLKNSDLSGMDFTSADLTGATLSSGVLRTTNLASAYLEGAHLEGADLTGAKLDGAKLAGATLTGAKLYGATFIGTEVDGADFDGAARNDLEGASGTPARLPQREG